MDFLGVITGLATGGASSILGGLTGLLGGWLKNKHDLQMHSLKMESKKLDYDHEISLMSKEADIAESMQSMKLEESMFVADHEALTTTIKAQEQESSWGKTAVEQAHPWILNGLAILTGLLTFIQKIIRPGLTVYLIVLVHLIWGDVQAVMTSEGVKLTSADFLPVMKSIINMVLYACNTALFFWFSTRPPKNHLMIK